MRCCGHNISLLVVIAHKLPIVRNVFDKIIGVSRLFVKRSKKTLLQEVVQQNLNYSRQQKVIFNVCFTRWLENLDGYNQFLLAYPYIDEALEVKLHLKKYPNWHQQDTESRRTVSVLLAGIATFEFCND